MATTRYLATNYFDADGVRTKWPFSFAGVSPDADSGTTPYLFPADVRAVELFRDVNGEQAIAERSVVIEAGFPNTAVIVGPPVLAGRKIKIFRQTELRFPLVDYRDRQSVSEADLDLANRQAIFVAQESQDLAAFNMQLDKHDNWDVRGRRLVNVGNAIDPGDAINLDQFRRSLRVGPNEPKLPVLPPVAERALQFLAFDRYGNPTTVTATSGSSADLQAKLANEDDPRYGSAMVGRSVAIVPSMKALLTQPHKPFNMFLVRGYWPEHQGHGGGYFLWDETMPRNRHNGGTIISPTVPWNGEKNTHTKFIMATGETDADALGCFVRKARSYYFVTDFGAISDWKAGEGFGTGFDNRAIFNQMMIWLPERIEVPKWGSGYAISSNISLTGVTDRTICGHGKLIKTGVKGLFSTEGCDNIHIGGLSMDLQVIPDEAAGGSLWNSSRPSTNYSFAVSLARTNNSSVRGVTVTNCAWDAIVAQGRVHGIGDTATQSENLVFDRCVVKNVRGSMLWMRAVLKGAMTNNHCSNDLDFAQKANAIFVVEWCDDIEVSGNQLYHIGDNSVGVGQPMTKHDNGRNKNIRVVNNYCFRSRYHTILIAQGQDCLVEGNILLRGGVQREMTGNTVDVLCGTICILGGINEPPNHRLVVRGNIIRDAYEIGIYCIDRPGTTMVAGSTNILLEGNVISRNGRPDFVGTRKANDSIRIQMPNTVSVKDNVIADGAGDGISVYGDAIVHGNHVYWMDGVGIHIPSDTLVNNRRLSGAVAHNVTAYNKSNGIRVWGKDAVVLAHNTAVGNGRGGEPGTEETTPGATARSGISVVSVTHVSSTGNECRGNGGPGIFYRACVSVRDVASIMADNGDKFTTANYKSGIYIEGTAQTKTKFVCIAPIITNETVQVHPIRGSNVDPASVVLDGTFTGHSAGVFGMQERSLINIPITPPTP